MHNSGSLSILLDQLKAGDRAALESLWERSFKRLVDLAQQQLRGRPLGVADAEDVALSVFDSFRCGIEQGRFPRLENREDFWQVVLLLIRQKVINLLQHESRQKRGGGKVQHFSALPDANSSTAEDPVAKHPRQEPTPASVAEASEEYRWLLRMLDNDELRMIAICKMEGYSNEEVAGRLGCSLATVERRLSLIRKIWSRRHEEAQAG
jgi:DNA-directed RNA polymerase specialized sigma24 family protein